MVRKLNLGSLLLPTQLHAGTKTAAGYVAYEIKRRARRARFTLKRSYRKCGADGGAQRARVELVLTRDHLLLAALLA